MSRSPNHLPVIACRFDEPTMLRLKIIADVLGVPKAQVIRELVGHGLKDWPRGLSGSAAARQLAELRSA